MTAELQQQAGAPLAPAEEPLPPPAPPWMIFLVGALLLAAATVHIILIRIGITIGTGASLAVSAVEVLLVGLAFIQIGWRRPFALFLWSLFIVFLALLVFVVAAGVELHTGPPMWAR